jgi:hypothetical protein
MDDGAGRAGGQRGQVAGIVVVDVDRRARQRGAEPRHDVADRQLFIVAGNQDRDRGFAAATVFIGLPSARQAVATSFNLRRFTIC